MRCCSLATGASTRQDWQPDGSVELTVFAEVVAAAAGDCGVLEVSAASCNIAVRSTVTLPDAGVQRVSVKVRRLFQVYLLLSTRNSCLNLVVVLPSVAPLKLQATVGCDVKLWWPCGYGEPVLHDLQVHSSPSSPLRTPARARASVVPGKNLVRHASANDKRLQRVV